MFASIGEDRGLKKRSAGSAEFNLASTDPGNALVEDLRALCLALPFALARTEAKSVMFTSCGPSEGKSFVSLNFAILLARAGQRVLLVDGDLRRGALASHLGQPSNAPGLSDILAGWRSFHDCIVREKTSGLECITVGTKAPNPSALLESARFGELVEEAEREFDVVVFDAPPAPALCDTAAIGRFAGATLLLVRCGLTTQAQLRSARRALEFGGVDITGIVLNGCARTSAYRRRYQLAYAPDSADPCV